MTTNKNSEKSTMHQVPVDNSVKPTLYDFVKRLIDITFSIVALVFLLPLLIMLVLLIKIESPGPVFYRQRRIGKFGRPFDFYKFRTMYLWADSTKFVKSLNESVGRSQDKKTDLFRIRDDTRVTGVGRWLRRTSLDELPQLFGLFRGDMSLVGPRPLLPYEWEVISGEFERRATVKPGLTGPWQVGTYWEAGLEEMMKMDLDYIERRSLLFDLLVLLKTIPVVIFGRGAR